MFGRLGVQELIIVLAIVLLIFGPRKLPEIGSALGKSIKGFRKASRDMQEEWDEDGQKNETDERAENNA